MLGERPRIPTRAPLDSQAAESEPLIVDQRVRPKQSFWAAADAGDRELTALMLARTDAERDTHRAAMVSEYTNAFVQRSTWAERNSVLEHLRDLVELLDPADARRALLKGALEDLRGWEDRNTPEPQPVPHGSAPSAALGTASDAGAVQVVALPAGPGDAVCGSSTDQPATATPG